MAPKGNKPKGKAKTWPLEDEEKIALADAILDDQAAIGKDWRGYMAVVGESELKTLDSAYQTATTMYRNLGAFVDTSMTSLRSFCEHAAKTHDERLAALEKKMESWKGPQLLTRMTVVAARRLKDMGLGDEEIQTFDAGFHADLMRKVHDTTKEQLKELRATHPPLLPKLESDLKRASRAPKKEPVNFSTAPRATPPRSVTTQVATQKRTEPSEPSAARAPRKNIVSAGSGLGPGKRKLAGEAELVAAKRRWQERSETHREELRELEKVVEVLQRRSKEQRKEVEWSLVSAKRMEKGLEATLKSVQETEEEMAVLKDRMGKLGDRMEVDE